MFHRIKLTAYETQQQLAAMLALMQKAPLKPTCAEEEVGAPQEAKVAGLAPKTVH